MMTDLLKYIWCTFVHSEHRACRFILGDTREVLYTCRKCQPKIHEEMYGKKQTDLWNNGYFVPLQVKSDMSGSVKLAVLFFRCFNHFYWFWKWKSN